MALSFISKNEQTVEQNIMLLETVCKKNNWPYQPEEFRLIYNLLFPNGYCSFSVYTQMEEVILVGNIYNIKSEPLENLIDQDYPYNNIYFELRYQEEDNWFSNKGLIFMYQFMKELLTYKPDWVFLDHDITVLYTIHNIDEFAKKYEFSPDAFSFDFTNPPQ